jgi:AraC-like DNA-binding protein
MKVRKSGWYSTLRGIRLKHKTKFDLKLPIKVIEWTPSSHVGAFHWHNYLEIGLCISGAGWFYFGNKKYEVEPGDVFVVNNQERHIAQSQLENPSRYLFVYFDLALIEQKDQELLLPFVYNSKQFENKIAANTCNAQEIGRLIQAIYVESQKQDHAYIRMIQSYVIQICVLLMRYYGNHASMKDRNRLLINYNKIQPALIYIKEHFREYVKLEDVASHISLSPSRVQHLFKEAVGEGFKEYLLHLRIDEARRYLSTTDYTILDICLKCGFQSHAPFYRAFKQLVGLTPQQYRDQHSVLAVFDNSSMELEKI